MLKKRSYTFDDDERKHGVSGGGRLALKDKSCESGRRNGPKEHASLSSGKVILTVKRERPSSGENKGEITLTLVDELDGQVIDNEGLSALRKKRILRITNEAEEQGYLISYRELSSILLTSLSTLKRDIANLRTRGLRVPLKGSRKKIGACS